MNTNEQWSIVNLSLQVYSGQALSNAEGLTLINVEEKKS
jgi:hypothetical protein